MSRSGEPWKPMNIICVGHRKSRRTAIIAMITIGESIGGIPRGTHDWGKFLTPEEFTAFIRSETSKWANLVKAANMRTD